MGFMDPKLGDNLLGIVYYLITTQSQLLKSLRKKVFESIEGKGKNAGNQHVPLLSQCFLLIP